MLNSDHKNVASKWPLGLQGKSQNRDSEDGGTGWQQSSARAGGIYDYSLGPVREDGCFPTSGQPSMPQF